MLLAAFSHGAGGLQDICVEYIVAHEDVLKRSGALRDLMHEPSLMYEILMRRGPGARPQTPLVRRGDGGAGN